MPLVRALIDAGPLVAYYNKGDKWHAQAQKFFENFRGQLLTTEPVATEVLWQLSADWRVQNEFLADLQKQLYEAVPLEASDYECIAALNEKYNDLPADFADLSIVAICKRMKILNVVSLDADFDVYRAYGKTSFTQLFQK